MSHIFSKLGIQGMPDKQEDALLACLLTGDPALLIGKQGTSKTGLVKALGAAMRESTRRKYPDDSSKWIRYHAYDSSKINFEDLIGFPDVKKMAEGITDFCQSEMTVWDKDIVVFDEFNRQLPERQNNIFEVIRSRTVMGMPTKTKWVFNCMNPFGMAGTQELDEALIDRHAVFVYVKDFHSLGHADQRKIISHRGQDDSPALKGYWGGDAGEYDITNDGPINDKLADVGDKIFEIMESAAIQFKEIEESVGEAYGVFISRFLSALNQEQNGKDWSTELSGRRAGMLYRTLIALRAVQLAKSKVIPRYKLPNLKECFKSGVAMGLPVGVAQATSKGMDANALNSVNANIDQLGDFFKAGSREAMISAVDTLFELLTTSSLARKIDILMNELTDEHSKNQVWQDILSPRKKETDEERIRREILLNIVAHLTTVAPDRVPENFRKPVIAAAGNAQGFKQLFSSLTLKGMSAFYADDINSHLKEMKSPFVRLQAKILYEDLLKGKGTLDQTEFREIHTRVESECKALESMMVRKNISDIDELEDQEEKAKKQAKKDADASKEAIQQVV